MAIKYIAQFGLISGGDYGEVMDYEEETIIADTDDEAIEKAEVKQEVYDVMESVAKRSKVTKEVILIAIRNQNNKRLIYYCGSAL